jgi:predicted Ser/Thr protein kinase
MKDTPTPDSLRPGDLVGPWQIEGYAGRGSYGAVYKARRAGQPHSKPVALKIAVFPSDPRFSREVELLSRNSHPGMPRLLDQGWWHASPEVAHPFVVMEWIRGRSLYEWARVQNPSGRDVLRVFAQVARTLEVLHRGECLHRDVKGDNILVEPEGRAVLVDFGSGTWKGAPPLTEWVVPPNTREYRSPESLRFEWNHGRKHGVLYETRPADDLYALGVAAYRLVAGVYPHPGTDPEALKAQLQVPLPARRPVRELNKRVVPELSALIERMLAKEPEARGTAREIAEAAEAAVEHARPAAHAPILALERPEAKAHAEPAQVARVSVVERAESGARAWEWRRVLLAAVMSLAVVGPCWMAPKSSPAPSVVVQAEAPAAEWTPDAGTRGLGDDALTERVDSQEIPLASEPISREFPKQPLPGQRRPPCPNRREAVLFGACWKRLADITPPCGDSYYELESSCYDPVMERSPLPTTQQPQ